MPKPASEPWALRGHVERTTLGGHSSMTHPHPETGMALDKVLYAAHTTTGGRTGIARSSDRALNVNRSTPRELGGAGGPGTNPEQMFPVGYSACFLGAMKAVAAGQKIKLPDDVSISADVGIGPIPAGFGVQLAMRVTVPGVLREQAEALVAAATRYVRIRMRRGGTSM